MITQPVIVGAGLAGLATAIAAAPRPVLLLSAGHLGASCSSILAQGGLAAALDPADNPGDHARDTVAAGAGLCDPAIVDFVCRTGPAAVAHLESWGVAFDREDKGNYRLSLEGAHSHRRVAHIDGDSTGAGLMRALIAKARATPSITIWENAVAVQIVRNDSGVTGVWVRHGEKLRLVPTSDLVLATGGAGALWAHASAPLESWGRGLILAHQAGATLRDLRFMQFHPTGLDTGRDPMPLISEAVRGEGAVLRDTFGDRLLADDLASRDIVSRAVWQKVSRGERVFLDARGISHFERRFPTVFALCRESKIDPSKQPIPVRPVAHYHMGGVAVDVLGRTSVPGLWAVGEVASTGLHGANRLASNSLLEASVFGLQIGARIKDSVRNAAPPTENREGVEENAQWMTPSDADRHAVRAVMSKDVGVLRDESGLARASVALSLLAKRSAMGRLALMVARDALAYPESRGSHVRTDESDFVFSPASPLPSFRNIAS